MDDGWMRWGTLPSSRIAGEMDGIDVVPPALILNAYAWYLSSIRLHLEGEVMQVGMHRCKW